MTLDAAIFACGADREGAARLTDGLGSAGLTVKLFLADKGEVPPEALAAPCRVIAISRSSECSAWLEELSSDLCDTQLAIAVRLESGAEAPGNLPTYDYFARGLASRLIAKAWLSDIAAAVRAIQQDTFPPRPTARWRMFFQELWSYLLALAAIVTVIGYFVPWDQIAQQFDWEEQAAFEALQSSDGGCEAMEAFLETYPEGRYSTQVRDALANPDSEVAYASDETRLPISGPLLTGDGYEDRSTAVQAAQDWALADAQRQCRNLSDELSGRSSKVEMGDLAEQCYEIGDRWLCAVDGESVCKVDAPVEQDVCRISNGASAGE